MNRTRITLFLLSILITQYSYSQILVTLPSHDSCPGDFMVPIQVQHFDSVASMSLKINYDSTILQYDTFSTLHPVFSDGLFMLNATHQQVILSWFSLNPVTIDSGEILILHFQQLYNNSTVLAWDTSPGSCALTDLNGNLLNTTYVDANIHSTFHPPILFSPIDYDQYVTLNPTLSWSTTNCSELYELQYSTDSTFQVNTETDITLLTQYIIPETLQPDTTCFWKVRSVMNGTIYNSGWSSVFRFRTLDPNGIGETSSSDAISFQLLPNPAHRNSTIKIQVNIPGRAKLKILTINGTEAGEVLNTFFQPGEYLLPFSCPELSDNIYLMEMNFNYQGMQLNLYSKFLYIGTK